MEQDDKIGYLTIITTICFFRIEVHGYPSSNKDKVPIPRSIPESIPTTKAEPQSLIYLVFYLETTVLSRSKNNIIYLA